MSHISKNELAVPAQAVDTAASRLGLAVDWQAELYRTYGSRVCQGKIYNPSDPGMHEIGLERCRVDTRRDGSQTIVPSLLGDRYRLMFDDEAYGFGLLDIVGHNCQKLVAELGIASIESAGYQVERLPEEAGVLRYAVHSVGGWQSEQQATWNEQTW